MQSITALRKCLGKIYSICISGNKTNAPELRLVHLFFSLPSYFRKVYRKFVISIFSRAALMLTAGTQWVVITQTYGSINKKKNKLFAVFVIFVL